MTKKEYISDNITKDLKKQVEKMEGILKELKFTINSSECNIETKIFRFQEASNNLTNLTSLSALNAYFDYSKNI